MDPTPQTPGEWIATLLGTGGVIALGWQRLRRMWSADGVATAQHEAQTDVVQLMRDELARMAEQNSKLAAFVNNLQLRVAELNDQNSVLQRTVASLREEVAQLHAQGKASV